MTPSPTRRPTSTPVPTSVPDPRRHVIAFVSDWMGNDDVYLYDLDTRSVVNLTGGQAEDRDPVFAPDGRSLLVRSDAEGAWAFYRIDLASGERAALADGAGEALYRGAIACAVPHADLCAYESYRDGNLDLYLRTAEGATQRLTEHPAGDLDPAWRPGVRQVAFTSWRAGQKDLYLIDVEDGRLERLTQGPGEAASPAWHPNGETLAFVRQAKGGADLYELALASGEVVRLTADPYPDRSPAYGLDGTLFWTRYVPGEAFEVHDPYRAGRWQLWMRAPGGQEMALPMSVAGMDVYTPAAGFALWPDLPLLSPPAPTPALQAAQGEQAGLTTLDIVCAGNHPQINAQLAGAYEAWRAGVLARTGYDVLGQISDMFRPLGYSGREYGHLSWHRTGRAVDLLFAWRVPGDDENRMLVVREDLGPQTYWRLYIRAREQDGTMGEPLADAPWVFWFELDPDKEASAYAAGGRLGPVPPGFYVDLTRLAGRHGWHRIASYQETDFDWRTDSVGREFWHYQRTDGLTWWEAMLEIYPLETVERFYGWSVCVDKLDMDPVWLAAKGIPAPAP